MTYNGWLDVSKSSQEEKVRKALAFYEKKYGFPPQIIEVSVYDEPLPKNLEVVVRVQRVHIPKNHFLLGVE